MQLGAWPPPGAPWARALAALAIVAACGISVEAADPRHPAAGAPPRPTPSRALVKLRVELAEQVERALPSETLVLPTARATSPDVEAFAARHGVKRLTPLYPFLVRIKKERGHSELEITNEVRRRFGRRATRFRGAFDPPALSRTYVVDLGPASPAERQRAIAELGSDPAVEYAEEDHVVSVRLTPNDPYFGTAGSWGQPYDDLWGIKKIGAPAAWDTATGQGVVVAVVDTGLDYSHPDIANNVWTNPGEIPGNGIDDDGNGYVDDVRGWDFVGSYYGLPTPDNDPADGYGHGTHVSGTIAAEGNNGVGVIGVAWRARVMPVKGLDDSGYGFDSTLAPAIIYAASNGADVISNSWGEAGSSQTIADAVAYAYSLGAVVVAAAGNSNDDARNFFPAALPQVITVAATDPYDGKAYFSNWGSKIDVAAPGVDILSLRATGTTLGPVVGTDYVRLDGTSMATPHVSGVAALVLGQHPEYSSEQVRQVLRVSAVDGGVPGPDLDYGYGRVSAVGAATQGPSLEVKLTGPVDGAAVRGPVDVYAVARGAGFMRYALEFGVGATPAAWTLVQESTAPAENVRIGTFDPATSADGILTLRLTAFGPGGEPYVDRIQVVVDYVSITAPVPPRVPNVASVFKPGAPLVISGRASGPSFQRYRVEWAPGIDPSTGWTDAGMSLAADGLAPVTDGTIATWDTSSIASADYYTIRLLVDNAGFTSEAKTLVYLEPDLLAAGWPRWLDEGPDDRSGLVPARDGGGHPRMVLVNPQWAVSSVPPKLRTFPVDGSSEQALTLSSASTLPPAVGDVDGAAGDEVVVAEYADVRVVRPDGTSYTLPVPGSAPLSFQNAAVVLQDLDGDGRPEILAVGSDLTSNVGYLFAWRRDGRLFGPRYPIALAEFNGSVQTPSGNRLLFADFDADGTREIAVLEGPTASTFVLRLFRADGAPKAWSAPTIVGDPWQMGGADLDGDGRREVVMTTSEGDDEYVHVFQPDGTERAGWPVRLETKYFGNLAIADLDRDGKDEIVIPNRSLYVLNGGGTSFSPAWPRLDTGTYIPYGPVAVADIDGDGYPEILVAHVESLPAYPNPLLGPAARVDAYPDRASFDFQLFALTRDDTIARSWRLLGARGNQSGPFATPIVGDFDGDGKTDISVSYLTILGGDVSGWLSEGVALILTTGAPAPPRGADWPMPYQNARNAAIANVAPVANAGPDKTVGQGTKVTLDGRRSTDADGTITAYSWRQLSGPAVSLTGANTSVARFTAPKVSATLTLVFELTVTDNDGARATAQLAITVKK